jgi:hypothetical protein
VAVGVQVTEHCAVVVPESVHFFVEGLNEPAVVLAPKVTSPVATGAEPPFAFVTVTVHVLGAPTAVSEQLTPVVVTRRTVSAALPALVRWMLSPP